MSLLHLQFYPFQELKLVLTLHKLEIKVRSFPSPQAPLHCAHDFLCETNHSHVPASWSLGVDGCRACPTTLWLLAMEVPVPSANQIWASGLRFCFLCPFWGSWRWWHMRLVSRVDLCLLQRWGHFPWGTEKSGQSMPNHPHILKYFGPRSHEIYSKTCGSNFFFCKMSFSMSHERN